MQYRVVEWIHDSPDEPVSLYYELDADRFERRKVEVYRDGTAHTADATHEQGDTGLAWEPHPPLSEIAADPVFRPREITAQEFERLWNNSVTPEIDLSVIAGRINTGTADADTSRALVVFNLTDGPFCGTAIFHADMSWPLGTPLPPVAVMEMDGTRVASALTDRTEGPDLKGRTDRVQLSFDLRFDVRDIPARSWKTYIAAYVQEPTLAFHNAALETPRLVVIETLRHVGDLPPVGTFADWVPSMVQ